ncbi:hypothetical protein [Marinococcus luteus]|uniref:hypothetical protein n=1 Tax=Marinococcus luteus TaxID=1122204 RepID=UPI002ACCA295|nr:hypothetical protein [Marinococcus luteus]MDZ5783926.1 hypothetical protein [Marinococcus luteus]
MRLVTYTLLVILYIAFQFVDISGEVIILGVLANIVILLSFFYARGLFFYSGLIFYTIGTLLFILNDLSLNAYFSSFTTMMSILAFFYMLPFLNSLIQVGKYDRNLRKFIEQSVKNIKQLYKRSFFVCHVLGLFLNIATFSVLMRTLDGTFKNTSKRVKSKFYTQNLLRAYALCLAWSPLEIMVITALNITGQEYIHVFPAIASIVMVVIVFDIAASSLKFPSVTFPQSQESSSSASLIRRKIFSLILLLALLVSCVSITSGWTGYDYLFTLVLFIAPISFFWSIIIRRLRRYTIFAVKQWQNRTRGMSNFFFMFLSAGLFVQMLAETPVFDTLQHAFTALHDQVFYFYLAIGLYFIVSSFVGFHPLVSVILLSEIIAPSLPDLSPVPLALVLIVTSLSPVMYSPFNISVSLVGNYLNVNPYRLGLWNLPFASGYILFTVVIAYCLQLFI